MNNAKTEGQFTGWHMLIFVLLFFGTIISVNIFMVTKALTSWTGLVVKNSYVASQEFNEKLAASEAQAALHLKVSLTYTDGELLFALADANAKPMTLNDVEIALTRPIGIALDRTLKLAPKGTGYAAKDELPAGVWNVVIHALVPGKPDFNYRARLIVAPPAIPGA